MADGGEGSLGDDGRGPESALPASGEPPDLGARLAVQGRVLHALMLREIMTRFGRENLGFFWLMGEPLLFTLGVMGMWYLVKGHLEHDVGIAPFILTGYTLLTLWRHVIGRAIHCFRQNTGLLFHRNVHYLDTLIARTLLEIGGTGLSFLIAYVPLYLFDVIEMVDDPLLLAGGWLYQSWFSFGIALILAGATELNDMVERFIQALMYLTLPLSGAFSMADWLPERVRETLLYSPLVHINEMFRDGLMGNAVVTYWDVSYLNLCCLVTTAIGLAIVHKASRSMSMQ